jgi:carbonic anhydrase
MNEDWVLCAEDLNQSPIDLTGAEEFHLPPIEIVMPEGQEAEVLNQGSVADALKTYALVQAHFHAPSEHTLDGEHYPMEMHFVHQAGDGPLAVLGLLIDEGEHNPGIEVLWTQLSASAGTRATVEIPDDLTEYLFPLDATGYFHYEGSLTTPPCSEGVRWYVRKAPTEFSKEQIAAFTAVYDHNNRPVQPLSDRVLSFDGDPELIVR